MLKENDTKKYIPEIEHIVLFRKKITKWFRKNGRHYPWRKTDDPYKILVAEMMLQRTKADQVARVYNEFFKEYKSLEEIFYSNKSNIQKVLQPLGLRWRIDNFIELTKVLIESHDSIVPSTREKLKSLPGVGDYIAGIVLSIAFNKNEWVVDSNVVRILKRYFNMWTTKEGRRDSHVINTAKIFSLEGNAKEANLGLIDFGALICLPRNPKCNKCILKNDCKYLKNLNKQQVNQNKQVH